MRKKILKLGCIDYLNCYPLYYQMEKTPIAGVEVIPAYPSKLNEMMQKGLLDISPISAAAYAQIQEDVKILPDFCLASIGYVRSVILISKVPIEDLDKKRIGLSTASQTSVVLLKCLLDKFYNIQPIYEPIHPDPSLKNTDAALVIGNEAMLNPLEAIPYTYDLGDLWLRKTGFPVVFAIFAVRNSILLSYPDQVKAVIDSYRKSLRCLKTESQILFRKAKEKYPNIAYDIPTYYQLLKYEFTDELKRALNFYFSTAHQLGFLEKVSALQFIP